MLALAHVRMRLLTLLRTPAYVAGTLAMPSVILIFLGIGLADTSAEANAIMASFTVFAVMGVAFFQFGVGIAEGRASPWSTFERILPASITVRLAGAVIPAVLFAAAAAGLVILVAHVFMPVALGAGAWLRLGLVLLGGSVPLALLGIAIGYWVSSRAALPIANIVYLGLAFGGGLFLSPRLFPDLLEAVSQCSCRGTSPSSPGGPSRMRLGRPDHGSGSRATRPPARCSPVGAIAATKESGTAERQDRAVGGEGILVRFFSGYPVGSDRPVGAVGPGPRWRGLIGSGRAAGTCVPERPSKSGSRLSIRSSPEAYAVGSST